MISETNIFPIANLDELSTSYRTYRIRGLNSGSLEYYKNRNQIVGRLSRAMKQPVEMFEDDERLFLGVPDGADQLPDSMIVTRANVRFDPLPGTRVLNYAARSPVTDRLCTRFIDFMVQAPLKARHALWQPGAGSAYYAKQALPGEGPIGRHEGFSVRAMITADGGIGLCVDSRSCFIDRRPLQKNMSRNDFRRLKGRHAIYRMGHDWFDIGLFALHDLPVSEVLVPMPDGGSVRLAEFIETRSRKPIPPELERLDPAGQVVVYQNTRGEERSAPAALCFLTHDTESREVRSSHRETIMAPSVRRAKIVDLCRKHIGEVRVGPSVMRLDTRPVEIDRKVFAMPDLSFGGGKVLSVSGTRNARNVSFANFGEGRREMLLDRSAGFHVRSHLDRQYLFLPKTVVDSWGEPFVAELRREVAALYPHGAFEPEVVPYNDVGIGHTFVDQARAILAAARTSCSRPGFATVMIHEIERGRRRAHDQLEAAILREFPKLDPSIRAAVLHSSKGRECYEQFVDSRGNPAYRVRGEKSGVFKSYVRNVVLSKILLASEKWPFVLTEPLHADVTIGIDVKRNTAGYTVVSESGRSIRFHSEPSRQSEKLLGSQIRSQLEALLRAEFNDRGRSLGPIVIHRDGRSFPEECAGAHAAFNTLREEGILLSDATLTIIEIHKTSPSPLRLFDVQQNGSSNRVENPSVGLHYITGNDGYLATTGRPFRRPGTSRPLHVRFVEGGLAFEQCLEDVFRLSNLTWTRPEDCLRLPITIKLTDRVLGEDATDYDEDALRFGESSGRESA
jgi:hypothetical protein